jgi:hypothetical protein
LKEKYSEEKLGFPKNNNYSMFLKEKKVISKEQKYF